MTDEQIRCRLLKLWRETNYDPGRVAVTELVIEMIQVEAERVARICLDYCAAEASCESIAQKCAARIGWTFGIAPEQGRRWTTETQGPVGDPRLDDDPASEP